ncbi:MAG: aldehyde dehydrogenase family protein [Myxococcota bacterium]
MNQADLTLPMRVGAIIQNEQVLFSNGPYSNRENPADVREVVTTADEGSRELTRSAIASARHAFNRDIKGWVSNANLREQVLRQTAVLMRANAKRLAAVVSLEVGMPMRQALPHVAAAADVFDFYAGYATKIYGEAILLPNGSLVNLLREPVGVVGMVLPWNFPLTQAARKVAPAMAVGCTMVIKPASYTAASTYELAKLLMEAGAPPGVVNFVSGPGATVGDELVENPEIDKLSFTGSTGVGRRVMQRAAVSLKRVSLELGGKNPFVLMEDADLDAAANSLVFGMFRNAGQACGATSRLLVHDKVHGKFMNKVLAKVAKLRVGSPKDTSTDMGPVISRGQEQSILKFIENARKDGAELLCGGHKLTTEEHAHGYFIAPTIFDKVDPASELAKEEVFGPMLAVTSFHDEDEAVQLANDSIFGLTASVFTGNQARALRLSRRIQAGTVWLGDAYTQPVQGIWGGFKQSGLGRELGPYGVEDFVEVKQVYTDGTGLTMKPHYGQILKD